MNKKYRLLLIVSVFGLLVILSAGTYAYLRKTPTQSGNNVINTLSCLDIDLSNITNGINLVNDFPITDDEGKARTPYIFKVTNNCHEPVRISINLESLALSSNQLSREYVKTAINEVGFNKTIVPLDTNTNTEATIEGALSNTLKIDSLSPLSSKDYELRVWIDEDVTKEQGMNKNYEGKIVVHADAIPQLDSSLIYCYTDDYEPGMTMTAGKVYINGQYTYKFNNSKKYDNDQEAIISSDDPDLDGWSVELTDLESTDPVTGSVCNFVNDKAVKNARYAYYTSKATSIDLSDFNTSTITIMGGMFQNIATTDLDLSTLDTSNVTDMGAMFYGYNGVNLDLSNFDTSNVTNMKYMFASTKASSLDLSSFDTSKVTDMSYMFENIQATSINLSSFDTSNVTDMNHMFYHSSNLTSLDLSSFNTSKVTDMSYMFDTLNKLTTLDVSGFDTSNVTNMDVMFYSLSNITSLDLSSFDTSKVTNMKQMFCNCTALTTVYASEGWNTSNVTVSTQMFYNDTKIKNYNKNYVDKTRAHYNTNGYFTYKAAPTT